MAAAVDTLIDTVVAGVVTSVIFVHTILITASAAATATIAAGPLQLL